MGGAFWGGFGPVKVVIFGLKKTRETSSPFNDEKQEICSFLAKGT